MKKLNQKGFSAVEVLVVIVIVGLIGTVGWLVYDRQQNQSNNDAPQSSTANTGSAPETEKDKTQADADKPNEDIKTISLNGATYSFALPKDWKLNETYGYPGPESNEKIAQITDPTGNYQLDIQTLDYQGSAEKGKTPLDNFKGIGGKTYYLHGYEGVAKKDYEVIFVSSCKTTHCMTPIDKTYELNLSIKRAGDNYSKGVAASAEELTTIKQLIASVKIQ